MAITITCLDDANHTISSSKKILSRQGELGETITFSLPSTLNAAYPRAWIMIQQPDGQLYYIDNGSGAGFTWPNPYTFTYNIGDRDTMLSSDGTLGIQIVLRDATPPAQTVEWRSRILYLTIEGSILSNVDSGGSLIDSLSSGTLDRLADIQYDSLADGDLLYRDTATGKWRNVTLVDGANISHVLNKTTGELTLQATGNISTLASDLVYTDAGGYYAGSDGETIGQEIGASLASKAPLASPALTGTPTVPTAAVGTNTTQIANTAFVNAEIANDAFLKTANASIGVTSDSTNANTYDFLTGMTLVGSYTSNMPLASEYWIVQCMKFDPGARTMFASALTSKKTFVRTQEAGTWGDWNPINIAATGSAPVFACRAWVNCAGVGGTIYGSGNVSSVSHDAPGVWTVNFTTALPDENYAIVGTTRYDATVLTLGQYQTTKSTTQVKIIVRNNSGTATNPDQMSIAVFR